MSITAALFLIDLFTGDVVMLYNFIVGCCYYFEKRNWLELIIMGGIGPVFGNILIHRPA
ncbi:hypothetical protein JF544_02145 [Halobacillus kuroshimensis]|uniref:Uncharacterized protein n=1 Tax=Halobacillus kuroshimensis TaxID=302481 RepID=A0ABS3DS12_9BACI|nr:hypothetical protein [Halobacillus kuroshimensis]MBN8234023.1 hypothetical protein [Halobacillus kuroshimensis]